MSQTNDPRFESDDLPPPPKGWELDAEGDPAQEQEEEVLRSLSVWPLPHWLYRLFRPLRRTKPVARDEWLAYYQGRYSSKAPNVEMFGRLLARNGFWDIPSPFVPGSRQATEFCQGGVLLADIVFLLDRWSSHVMEQGNDFFDSGPTDRLSGEDASNPYIHANLTSSGVDTSYPLDQDSFSPIHRHIAMQARADACQQLEYARAAAQCLSLLFLDAPAQWTWISEHLHVDNRVLLCKIVHDAVPADTQARLRAAWVRNLWLSEGAAERLAKVTRAPKNTRATTVPENR